MALGTDEGRGKAAKSLGELSCKLSRGCPNGETRPAGNGGSSALRRRGTGGTETSKYPEEKRLFP